MLLLLKLKFVYVGGKGFVVILANVAAIVAVTVLVQEKRKLSLKLVEF